jgi:hypothetical protein
VDSNSRFRLFGAKTAAFRYFPFSALEHRPPNCQRTGRPLGVNQRGAKMKQALQTETPSRKTRLRCSRCLAAEPVVFKCFVAGCPGRFMPLDSIDLAAMVKRQLLRSSCSRKTCGGATFIDLAPFRLCGFGRVLRPSYWWRRSRFSHSHAGSSGFRRCRGRPDTSRPHWTGARIASGCT